MPVEPDVRAVKNHFPFNAIEAFSLLHRNRSLLRQFVLRIFQERHKSSLLGVVWAVLLPVMMMGLYTFVFGYIFGSSYNVIPQENKLDFGLGIFLSLTLFGLVAESCTLAPTVIVNQPNLVKKVVFPLEILPVANLGASLINFLISIGLFLIGQVYFGRGVTWDALWFPLIAFPLILLSMGLYWIFSALGVFLRDLSQLMVFFAQAMLYSSAIFYSTNKVKGTPMEFLLPVLELNPIVHAVELSRNVLLWQIPMHLTDLGFLYGFGVVTAVLGFTLFRKLKPAFSDVI
jgi:lipopolysaccharide transport system permease protein